MKIIDENIQKRADIIQKFNDETYRNYFFEQSLKYQDDRLKWWLKDIYDKRKEYFEFNEYIRHFTDFLKEVAIQNRDNKDEKIEQILLTSVDNFLKSQSKYKENSYDFENIFDILFCLGVKYITCERIEKIFPFLQTNIFILHKVSYIFPILIKNNLIEQIKLFLKFILQYEIDEDKKFRNINSKFYIEDVKKILFKYSSDLIESLNGDLKQILEDFINEIYKKDKMTFSIFRIQSIENLDKLVNEIYSDEYEILLIWFYKELIWSIADKNLIEANLKKKNPIYKRIAFYIINLRYDDYKDIFWKWFGKNSISEKYIYFRHEFYFVLQNNYTKFSDDELKRLTDNIEKSKFSYDKKYSENQIMAKEAWRKKEWLWAIKNANDNVKQMYEKYDNIAPGEIANPGFDFYVSKVKAIPNELNIDDKSSFDFKEKKLDEIIKIIKDKNILKQIEKQDNYWYYDSPKEYLATLLRGDINANFKKYENNLSELLELECIYIYYAITKISDNLEQILDINNILNFIEKLLDLKRYNDEYFNLSIGDSAWLIYYDILKNKNFKKEHLKKIKEIIFKMLEVKKKEEIKDYYNDLFSSMLNHNDGKILIALIEYIRVYASFNNKEESLEKEVKEFFEKELSQNNAYSQFIFCIFGAYLGIFYFADEEWVNNNFNKIFPLEKENLWLISFSAYFIHNRTNRHIYKKFLENRHFEKAIALFNDEKLKNEEFIEQICVAYRYDIDDKTIFELLNSKNEKILLKIINFMSLYEYVEAEEENIKIKRKICDLWNKIFESFSESEVIYNLYQWFKFLDNIDDDTFEKMKKIFSFMKNNIGYNFAKSIEIFLKILNDSNSEKITNLLLYITEELKIYITWDTENFDTLLDELSKKPENQESIKKIKNLYLNYKYS